MNHRYLIALIAALLGAVFLLVAGCNTAPSFDGLKLVARYKPIHLYVYANGRSTNILPGLVIREGKCPIYMREDISNRIVLRQYEKNNEVLLTEFGLKGSVASRIVTFWNANVPEFTYFDTNGDGLFDYFIIETKTNQTPALYIRKNMSWVLAKSKAEIKRAIK